MWYLQGALGLLPAGDVSNTPQTDIWDAFLPDAKVVQFSGRFIFKKTKTSIFKAEIDS